VLPVLRVHTAQDPPVLLVLQEPIKQRHLEQLLVPPVRLVLLAPMLPRHVVPALTGFVLLV